MEESLDLPDYGSCQAKVFTPALRIPTAEECLWREFQLRIKTIISKETVVQGKKNDLSRMRNNDDLLSSSQQHQGDEAG